MRLVEEHSSPDGMLRLTVIRDDDGDITITFHGCQWHTHGDILSSQSGKPETEAIRDFVNSIVSDDQILAVAHANNKVLDVWPTDDPAHELRHMPPNESLEIRRWSGEVIQMPIA